MITLRLATVEDVPRIRELADEIWRAVYPGIISHAQIDFMLDWMYAERQLTDDITTGEIRFWMINLDGESIGFASMGPGESTNELHLQKFYLRANLHGRGYGSAALRQLLDEARESGAHELSLRVNKTNERAIRCYERNGFERVREICDDIGEGFVMDDHWMTHPLNAS